MFRKFVLLSAASIVMIGSAQAADIVEPVAFDWTGPYIGIQGGYAWGDNDAEVDVDEPPPSSVPTLQAITLFPAEDGEIELDGWVGGLHLGYLWQHDSFVFGIEGDGEFADMDGDTEVFVAPDDPGPVGQVEQDIDWLASLRLRAGFALDRALIYATGGLAVGGVEVSFNDDNVPDINNPDVDESDTEWGWTLGGGLEFAFTDELSARIEYRYTDLGKTDVTFEDVTYEVENNFHAVRVGLSWHFGGDAI